MSCSTNPNYQNNLKLAKKWVQAFETSNVELWKEVVSEELIDIAPMYGMGQVDYKTALQVAEFYVQNYTNVKFENQVWLPGIDTLTMKPDGSVRAYGTWTGTSKSTGRNFSLNSYHNFDFKDGKISSTGEYFDATGMINSVGPAQRNVVVATAKVSKKNIDKFQFIDKSNLYSFFLFLSFYHIPLLVSTSIMRPLTNHTFIFSLVSINIKNFSTESFNEKAVFFSSRN